MRRTLLLPVSLAWLLVVCAFAPQQQQPPTPPPQTPPATPPTTPPTTPPSQPPGSSTGTSTIQSNTRDPFEFARPIYLIGCVRMDNGSVPSEPVRVWLARPGSGGGVPRAGGGIEVDVRGCFKLQVGIAGVDTRDSRMSGARTSEDLYGWDVKAELLGYGGGSVQIKEHTNFVDIDVGTIVLTPFPNLEPGTVSLNSLSAPREAREAYLKARNQLDGKNPDRAKAAKELQKAVAKYEKYASAWQLLGEISEYQKDELQARRSFEKAIAADPKYVTPYLSLGNIELRNQRWDELAKLSENIIQLTPDSVEGQYFQAVSNYRLRNLEVAEKAARYVVDKNQAEKYPSVHLILGDILSQRGEIPPAAAHFRSFLSLRPDGQNAQMVRSRLQAWEQEGLLSKP